MPEATLNTVQRSQEHTLHFGEKSKVQVSSPDATSFWIYGEYGSTSLSWEAMQSLIAALRIFQQWHEQLQIGEAE